MENKKYPSISFVLNEMVREARALKFEAGIIIDYLNKENKILKSKVKLIKENGFLNVNVKRKDIIKQYVFKFGDTFNTLFKKFKGSVKNLEKSINLLYGNHQ